MQILEIFTVYDSAAKCYITPFLLPNEDMAKRSFSDAVNDFGHQFNKHPHDYTLYRLGNFNLVSGIIEADTPQAIGNAQAFKKYEDHANNQMDIEDALQRTTQPQVEPVPPVSITKKPIEKKKGLNL